MDVSSQPSVLSQAHETKLPLEVITKYKVVLVVPAYNESKVIQATVESVLDRGYDVVVVDDGSKDDTWAILKTLPVYSIRHPINLGQGAALQTGMTYALKLGADIVVHFDADGQHDPDEIVSMIVPLMEGQTDIVLGSRFLREEDLEEVPFARKLLLKGAIVVNGLLTGLWLSDAHNGFRALSREAVEKIYLKENGFTHASEILFQIRKSNLRILEMPTKIRYSEYSQKKGQSSLNAINIFLDLVLRKLFS